MMKIRTDGTSNGNHLKMPVLQLHAQCRLNRWLVLQRLPLGIDGLGNHPRIGIAPEAVLDPGESRTRDGFSFAIVVLGRRGPSVGILLLFAALQVHVGHGECLQNEVGRLGNEGRQEGSLVVMGGATSVGDVEHATEGPFKGPWIDGEAGYVVSQASWMCI